jgi:hypothetical protein
MPIPKSESQNQTIPQQLMKKTKKFLNLSKKSKQNPS